MKTIPFTYLLRFKPTGQLYYGSRYGKGCHPEQLWTSYFTSSKKIKTLIEQHGKESFEFEIRKTFTTRESAREWETRFLCKVKAAQSNLWLNQHNGAKNFFCLGHHGLIGHKQSEETKLKRRLANLGKKRPEFSEEHKNKLSQSAKNRRWSDEAKKQMSENRKGIRKPPQKQVICPHCNKEGAIRNMMRYHFDNCKSFLRTI